MSQPYPRGAQAPPPLPSGSHIPGAAPGTAAISPISGAAQYAPPAMLPMEQSYIENILRLNRGKVATVYATYEQNSEWNTLIFRGIVEEAGRDHLILTDPETGTSYLLRMVNVDYITFDEPIAYVPLGYQGQPLPPLTTAPPR